jgi:hypothetical protein
MGSYSTDSVTEDLDCRGNIKISEFKENREANMNSNWKRKYLQIQRENVKWTCDSLLLFWILASIHKEQFMFVCFH